MILSLKDVCFGRIQCPIVRIGNWELLSLKHANTEQYKYGQYI